MKLNNPFDGDTWSVDEVSSCFDKVSGSFDEVNTRLDEVSGSNVRLNNHLDGDTWSFDVISLRIFNPYNHSLILPKSLIFYILGFMCGKKIH